MSRVHEGPDEGRVVGAELETPIGTVVVIATDAGLRAVSLPAPDGAAVPPPHGFDIDPDHPVLASALTQISEYFDGARRDFDVPLDLVGTQFQRACWSALASVGYATTITYGEQAIRVGRPTAVRAVGGANRVNPVPIVLPCHRVVGSNGSLTGFAGGLEMKRWLLGHERDVADTVATR